MRATPLSPLRDKSLIVHGLPEGIGQRVNGREASSALPWGRGNLLRQHPGDKAVLQEGSIKGESESGFIYASYNRNFVPGLGSLIGSRHHPLDSPDIRPRCSRDQRAHFCPHSAGSGRTGLRKGAARWSAGNLQISARRSGPAAGAGRSLAAAFSGGLPATAPDSWAGVAAAHPRQKVEQSDPVAAPVRKAGASEGQAAEVRAGPAGRLRRRPCLPVLSGLAAPAGPVPLRSRRATSGWGSG